MGMAVQCNHRPFQWKTHSTLSSGCACLFLPLSSLHTLASLWSLAAGYVTSKALLMGQQCQVNTFHGFIPCSIQSKTWPGLLLVLRFVLLLVFAFNPQQDPSITLLGIQVGTGLLYLWACDGVYRNWCLDALEGSFILNLIILCAATYHVNLSGGNQLAVGYASVTVAFTTFIGILAYHICQQLRHTKLGEMVS